MGGTGSRVVNNVVKELNRNNVEFNNGQICCAVLDTNVNDNELIEGSGTGVPVIGTSKPKKIREYLQDNAHLHWETWCPQSPAFLVQSMIDGASELRVKSRIAFEDCVVNGDLDATLGIHINEVLKNGTGSKIRVMIVSSLSGGTGSGMFIQVALWLRKYLCDSEITIRGIFLLPDVFVGTLKDIRENATTRVRHYCNAYAAVRELNAISKIKKNNLVKLSEEVALGELFDSRKDNDSGTPVYDFAFFVDQYDENSVRLESQGEYEQAVAQLVYMQLFAPMSSPMYSEEDNAFLSYVNNDEPLYGSCGTAKAVYPTESVKKYCAIRAAKDSVTGGWNKIDSEINALRKEIEQEEKDGVSYGKTVDTRIEYIKLFDEKISVKPEEAGKDRFFVSIAKDVKNETKNKQEDKVVIKESDKVADFVKLLKSSKIDTFATANAGTTQYAIDVEAFVEDEHTKDELLERVENDKNGLAEVLNTFEAKVNESADGIVNTIFPLSMGDVKPGNRATVYGLLTKQDDKGDYRFIHPVAARYVLYKLVKELEKSVNGIALNQSKKMALSGGDVGAKFDNKATTDTETTPEAFLESKKWYQLEASFLDDFEKRYGEFINTKIGLCEKYEKEYVLVIVYNKLIERLNLLIKQLEAFFAKLDEVQQDIDKALSDNVCETNGIVGKTVYVYGGANEKEATYQSLDFELDKSNEKINKGVIDAVYGRLCAEKRPAVDANMKYAKISVTSAFIKEILETYMEKIDNDANNSEKVNLDIYSAICKESDAKLTAKGQSISDEEDTYDITTGTVKAGKAAANRYRDAFISCKNRLFTMAAPFLKHEKEVSDDDLGTTTSRQKTFWGFSPEVAKTCPFLGAALGINPDTQADAAYPGNELYCYRAVYGMEASYIPAFNELKNGKYYESYHHIISEMIQDADGKAGERALVSSPHLDKNWHRILPYITPAKQLQDDLDFFHGFWLAIAYGLLRTDKDGYLYLRRSVDTGYGNFVDRDVFVEYEGKKLTKTDVKKFIAALRSDKVFTDTDIPKLEEQFQEELKEMVNYVDTDVFKGLTVKKEDLNPINVIARYKEAAGHDESIYAALIGSLEKIPEQMAEKYDVERTKQAVEAAKFRICKKIYDSSSRTKGKSESFGSWETAFEKYKIV